MKKIKKFVLKVKDRSIKIKQINELKTKQNRNMYRIYLNARVYAKHKINLTWPKFSAIMERRITRTL